MKFLVKVKKNGVTAEAEFEVEDKEQALNKARFHGLLGALLMPPPPELTIGAGSHTMAIVTVTEVV